MLAEFITNRMTELGIRQHELAERSTLSRQYVSDLVRGKRGARMSLRTQQKLAQGLKVSPKKIADCAAIADPKNAIADKGNHDACQE